MTSNSLKMDETASLLPKVKICTTLGIQHAWNIAKPDAHWCGELRANVTITAEQIFLYQSLKRLPIPDGPQYKRYLLSEQQQDGSWSIAPHHPGDVSTSAEAYLALKILGMHPSSPEMRKARDFIRGAGGVAKVRVFTRIFFAQFGLFPWDSVPQLPAEFIYMPPASLMNIYRLSSWARSTLVPLMIVRHHEHIYALPNGLSQSNDYLDELWLDPAHKMVPYYPPLLGSSWPDPFALVFVGIDLALYWLGGLKRFPLRHLALQRCVSWILERQEVEGDWAGIIPPMHAGIQALLLEGYNMTDDVICRGIEAIERFTWQDEVGKRLQPCVSPGWDTLLMTRALCDAGVDLHDRRIQRAVHWVTSRQLIGPEGDWCTYNPRLTSGGFSFEYNNKWYPDIDDTGAAILTLLKQNPDSVDSLVVSRAAIWICGMQNRDGGWGAFDMDNDRLWLNKIPFSDMDSLCDPSTADVTGRILEAFGLMLKSSKVSKIDKEVFRQISRACDAATSYLAATQESTGAWYGRWGVNYVYGTSNVLCGLQYFAAGRESVQDMMCRATDWLKKAQNPDGGWGELLDSYKDVSLAGCGPSTASQTAWGLMGVLTTCTPHDASVIAGVSHLVATQTDKQGTGATWPESRHTGTGFPNFFYLGYSLYPHYFPLMALGRFLNAAGSARSTKGLEADCA